MKTKTYICVSRTRGFVGNTHSARCDAEFNFIDNWGIEKLDATLESHTKTVRLPLKF